MPAKLLIFVHGRAMMWAASKGRYFLSKIDGKYPKELVTG